MEPRGNENAEETVDPVPGAMLLLFPLAWIYFFILVIMQVVEEDK